MSASYAFQEEDPELLHFRMLLGSLRSGELNESGSLRRGSLHGVVLMEEGVSAWDSPDGGVLYLAFSWAPTPTPASL